jgi:hypothetical protein
MGWELFFLEVALFPLVGVAALLFMELRRGDHEV